MNGRAVRRVLVALAAVLAVAAVFLGVRACSAPSANGPAPSTPPPSATATGPLTAPALAAKIDNTAKSHPHVGVADADVVYVEPVEGGLTRLLAVWSSRVPKEIGPVRSARESDLAILGNYGPVAFAYSGASSYTSRLLEKGAQVNLSYAASSQGFRREASRPPPYNVIGDPVALLARAKGSAVPEDPGFVFGAAPPGGAPATEVAARWPAARVSFTWDAGRGEYLLSTDGRADVDPQGRQHGATTVVVQVVTTTPSRNKDVTGAATPVVRLTGTGEVTVLRGGKAWSGTWAREGPTARTAFRDTTGATLTMDPGGTTWVLLVPSGGAVTVR